LPTTWTAPADLKKFSSLHSASSPIEEIPSYPFRSDHAVRSIYNRKQNIHPDTLRNLFLLAANCEVIAAQSLHFEKSSRSMQGRGYQTILLESSQLRDPEQLRFSL